MEYKIPDSINFLNNDFSFLDSIGFKSWVKMDYDNNGQIDLFVTGIYNQEFVDQSLILSFDTGYKRIKLPNKYNFGNLVLQFPIFKCKEKILIYQSKKRRNIDTLVYNNGFIIEESLLSKSKKLSDSISFSYTWKVRGGNVKYQITLYKRGGAHVKVSKEGKLISNNKFGDSEGIKSIWNGLSIIGFNKLQDKYVERGDDLDSISLITYKKGKKSKQVEDYGMRSTFVLMQIYDSLINEFIIKGNS